MLRINIQVRLPSTLPMMSFKKMKPKRYSLQVWDELNIAFSAQAVTDLTFGKPLPLFLTGTLPEGAYWIRKGMPALNLRVFMAAFSRSVALKYLGCHETQLDSFIYIFLRELPSQNVAFHGDTCSMDILQTRSMILGWINRSAPDRK